MRWKGKRTPRYLFGLLGKETVSFAKKVTVGAVVWKPRDNDGRVFDFINRCLGEFIEELPGQPVTGR